MTTPLKKPYTIEENFGGELVTPISEWPVKPAFLVIALLVVALVVWVSFHATPRIINPADAAPASAEEVGLPVVQDADPRAAPEPLLEGIPETLPAR